VFIAKHIAKKEISIPSFCAKNDKRKGENE